MSEIFKAEHYQFSALSIPFAIATVVVLLVGIYVALVRGAPVLRWSLLMVCAGLLPYVAASALVGSTQDPEVAKHLYKLGFALLGFASAGAMLFELALIHRVPQFKWVIIASLVVSTAMGVLGLTTDLMVGGIRETSTGLLYFTMGPLGPLGSSMIGLWVGIGVITVWRRIDLEPSPARRKVLRNASLAFSLCALGLLDVPLSYGIGWHPIAWLALTAGLLLALRLLIADDLIHAQDFDRTVPLGVLYVVVAAAAVWLLRDSLGPDASIPLFTVCIVALYYALRAMLGLIELSLRPTAKQERDSPLDRALSRYAETVQRLTGEDEVGNETIEIIKLGLGAERIGFFLPSEEDYSWVKLDGGVLPESHTPDPLTLGWLTEQNEPILKDTLSTLRLGDLREPIERLFEVHRAEVIVPLVNRDELVGIVTVGELPDGRAVRADEQRFLHRLRDHASSALVYARMHREASRRVEVDKDVELAAAVQTGFVPGDEVIDVADGRVTVAGAYTPASQCGGDWWSVHELPDKRVLVLIGDVTGHGIAAAMVTAAAKGCYDVAQRLMATDLDLVRLLELLDRSVRRVGAGKFHMTCFATLLDPAQRTVTYANAGHVVPYLCRKSGDRGYDLDALVARGNPLGAGDNPKYRQDTAALEEGDILVWYTDGIVECMNHQQRQFGDRRMQRLLRKLDTEDVVKVREKVLRASAAFREGVPADDDITLVVGRVT